MSITSANDTFDAQDFNVTGTYFTTAEGSLMALTAGYPSTADLVFSLMRATETGNGQSLLSINLAYEVRVGSISSVTPSLSIIEHTTSGETVIPVAATASGFGTAVGNYVGLLTLDTPMFDTDVDNRLLRFRIVFQATTGGRRVLVRSAEATYDHQMISRDSEFAGCTISTRIDSLPYVCSTPGKYRVDSELSIASGSGITISSDDVCVDFCCGGSILMTGVGTIGIDVGAVDDVTIRGPVLAGVSGNSQIGVNVGGTIKVLVQGGNMSGLEEGVHIDDASGDVVVNEPKFTNCANGVQVLRGSTISGLRVLNCVGTNTQTWHLVQMDGICANCKVSKCDSTYGRIWVWQCQNSKVKGNRVHVPTATGDTNWFNALIGCGGWRPTTPPAPITMPASEKFGCSACRVENNQVSVGNYVAGPGLVTYFGIFCQFCTACSMDNNNVNMNDPRGTALSSNYFTVNFCSSYCNSCTYNSSHGAQAAFGFFICDVWDENVFCKNSSLYNCTSAGCYYTYLGQRCVGIKWYGCTAADGEVGWYISEGAIGSVVERCSGTQMSHAGVWNLRSTGGGTKQLVTDPFLAPPVKTVVRDSTFIQTTNGIYAGDVGAQPGDGTPYADISIGNLVI